MNLNNLCLNISRLKKNFLFYLSVIPFIFLSVSSLPAEDSSAFFISSPEYKKNSSGDFTPSDIDPVLLRLHNDIYSIFSHYSPGRVHKGDISEIDNYNDFRIIKSELTATGIIESEKGGFFCQLELYLYEKDAEHSIRMKYTGYGESKNDAFFDAFIKLPNQLEHRYADFEGKNGFYRILDIYQNEIIVNCGKKDGFGKGDYLEIFNSSEEKPEGRILLTNSDKDISYGRLIYWKPLSFDKNFIKESKSKPSAGARVRKINYLGIDASVSYNYIFDDLFTGSGIVFNLEYFRNLYIFHPFAEAGFYNFESSISNYELNTLSAGIAMLRHLGKISMYSKAMISGAWYRNAADSSGNFRGGAVKAGIKYSISRHTGIFAETGFMHLFPSEENDPDLEGFLFGAGLSFKY